jgi:16S rRNA (guanine966-N2)-methyltransferase
VRIISGKYKSRRVYTSSPAKENCVKGNISGFRPTTDRAKETLFNTLNNILDFEDIVCLDLFAGSGSLGFESLSRGAVKCDFVETSSKQIAMINKTAAELGCEEQIRVYASDVMKFLKITAAGKYDLVFADPPFTYENYGELVEEVMHLKFGIFVLEYGTEFNFMYNTSEYDLIDKKVGAVSFKIFVNKND